MSDERPGLIMCVCTGKCPGFSKMDIWDFINRARVELPVAYGFIHPQLCEEDGDRFLADILKSGRKQVIAACAPGMQRKLFRDAFASAGLDAASGLTADDLAWTTHAHPTLPEALHEAALGFRGAAVHAHNR